jgi:hypothetical protein
MLVCLISNHPNTLTEKNHSITALVYNNLSIDSYTPRCHKDTHMVMNHPMIIRVPFVHCLIYHRDSNVKFYCTMVYILLCEQITHSIRSSVGHRLFGNGKYNVNNFTDNPYTGTKINSVKMSIKTSY